MRFGGHTRCVLICAAVVWPAVAQTQVVAQLNEQDRRGAFEEIGSGSFTQFVGDHFVAFGGEELSGRYDGLWLRDVRAPRGVIQKLGFRPPSAWSISPDARHVAFVSDAQDLVSPTSNLCWHSIAVNTEALRPCHNLYVRDLETGFVSRIHGPEGQEIAADSGIGRFSADGRWIVFQRSLSSTPGFHPLQVLLHDRTLGTTTLVSGSLHAHTPTVLSAEFRDRAHNQIARPHLFATVALARHIGAPLTLDQPPILIRRELCHEQIRYPFPYTEGVEGRHHLLFTASRRLARLRDHGKPGRGVRPRRRSIRILLASIPSKRTCEGRSAIGSNIVQGLT